MKKLPYMRFYTKDYLADQRVVEMTPLEEHAYLRLLMYCWQEGHIPPDVKRLAVLCKQTPEVMAHIWAAIKDRFQPGEEGWVNKRVEHERAEALEKAEVNRQNGLKGARVRYGHKRRETAA